MQSALALSPVYRLTKLDEFIFTSNQVPDVCARAFLPAIYSTCLTVTANICDVDTCKSLPVEQVQRSQMLPLAIRASSFPKHDQSLREP